MSRNNWRIFMHHGPAYINLLRNEVYNLFVNTHVRIKLYLEFYHSIIYIANEVRHVRIKEINHGSQNVF